MVELSIVLYPREERLFSSLGDKKYYECTKISGGRKGKLW
jgi:hypothetical protein